MGKRIKRKGGKMQYTQTVFNHTTEAFKSFEEDVLKCIRRDPRESLKSCARISFKVEWEPEDVAYLLNEQVIAKDKLHRSPSIPDFKNPLKAEVSHG